MPDPRAQRWPDARLIDALRRVEPEIAWPVAAPSDTSPDLAVTVRRRIESMPAPSAGPIIGTGRWSPPWIGRATRPAQRALLLAIALLIALVAIAGAAGVGLPGLRVLFGGGSPSPLPSLAPSGAPSTAPIRSAVAGRPGAALQLGEPVSPSDADAIDAGAGFHVRFPTDPRVGAPDAAWVDRSKHGQVSLVWSARDDLPATREPGVGLLMTEFLGSVDDGFYSKLVGSGTTVEAVVVGGRQGYWLSGEPHFFFYTGPGGVIRDERRWVGDALIWSDGAVTYRIESAIGRDSTMRIAESVR
jgi:hypothetical protein